MPKRKIRKFLINPRFQLVFIGAMLLVSALAIFSFFFAFLFFFSELTKIGHSFQLSQDHLFFKIIEKERDAAKMLFLYVSVGVFVVINFIGFVLSHRVAGPLYRLQQHFIQNRDHKKPTLLKFRKHDFFQEIAEIYNELSSKKNAR